jgi:hypothetical protein
MMNEQLTPADVLERAADHINTYGWFACNPPRHTSEHPDRACAIYAICLIGKRYQGRGIAASAEYLEQFIGPSWSSIPDWNNADGRTAEEVTSTMRAAAVVWRAQNQPNPVPAGAQESEIGAKSGIYPTSGSPRQEPHTA